MPSTLSTLFKLRRPPYETSSMSFMRQLASSTMSGAVLQLAHPHRHSRADGDHRREESAVRRRQLNMRILFVVIISRRLFLCAPSSLLMVLCALIQPRDDAGHITGDTETCVSSGRDSYPDHFGDRRLGEGGFT